MSTEYLPCGGDDTQLIQGILDAEGSIYLTETDQPYVIAGLKPPSGSVIHCRSRGVIIEAPMGRSMIETSKNTHSVRIYSGTWRGGKSLWTSSKTSTKVPSVNACYFGDINVEAMDGAAFSFVSSVGNTWENCYVGLGTLTGWELGDQATYDGVSPNACNHNFWIRCRAMGCAVGIKLVNSVTAVAQPKRGNYIQGCWFEQNQNIAVYAGRGASHLEIEGCYFEGQPTAIHLEGLGDEVDMVPSVFVSGCTFNSIKTPGKEYLVSTGNVALNVRDCTAVLQFSKTFALLSEENSWTSRFDRVYLDIKGGSQNYDARLVDNPDQQTVCTEQP